MKVTETIVLILAAVACTAATPAVADDPRTDAEQLLDLCQQYCRSFDLIHGNSMYYGGGVDDARQALTTIEEAEREALPAVQPILAVFADNYGTTSMEVSNTFHKLGIELDQNIGNRFDELYRGVSNVDKSRKASAEGIVNRTKMDTGNMERYTPEIRVRKMKQAKELLVIGQKLDPSNADINAMLATVDADIASLAEAVEQEIDAATWAGNTGSFAGPGSTRELAAAALDFFRSHPNWGGKTDKKVEVLAVAVRGDWDVAETDIFGRVVSWRLPVHLAITNSDLEGKGLARVYELSAVTRQGNPGATTKAPPFGAYWVGNSWMMLLSKVKSGG